MLYTEYLECAKKHVLGCGQMLASYKENGQNDINVWLELYYLSGYILEAITVYSVYKLGGWQSNVDIRVHDPVFVAATNVDFYGYDRVINTLHGKSYYPYRNQTTYPLDIKHHNFRQIINSKLRIEPCFNTIPYFGTCDPRDIDSDIVTLLDNWSVNVRYESAATTSANLTKDKISRLYSTCLSIVTGVINNV